MFNKTSSAWRSIVYLQFTVLRNGIVTGNLQNDPCIYILHREKHSFPAEYERLRAQEVLSWRSVLKSSVTWGKFEITFLHSCVF